MQRNSISVLLLMTQPSQDLAGSELESELDAPALHPASSKAGTKINGRRLLCT